MWVVAACHIKHTYPECDVCQTSPRTPGSYINLHWEVEGKGSLTCLLWWWCNDPSTLCNTVEHQQLGNCKGWDVVVVYTSSICLVLNVHPIQYPVDQNKEWWRPKFLLAAWLKWPTKWEPCVKLHTTPLLSWSQAFLRAGPMSFPSVRRVSPTAEYAIRLESSERHLFLSLVR